MAASDYDRWITDYANDLAGYDPMDVRLVCAQWRASPERRMPTPGEIIAKCRQLVKPELLRRIEPAPRPQRSPEERERMRVMLAQMIEDIAARKRMRGPHDRLSGETEVEYGRRHWPNRERKPA